MILTAEKAALARALDHVTSAVARRTTIPILAHVLVEAEGDSIRLAGTDMDLWASAEARADVAKPGRICVHAATLEGFVKRLPDGAQASLGFDPEKARLSVKSGRSRCDVPTLPADDFPSMAAAPDKDGGDAAAMTVAGKDLARTLGIVRFAISTEETRYYLNGVYMHKDRAREGEIVLVATDGHRLARATLAVAASGAALPPVIVPRQAVGALIRMAEAAEEVALRVSETLLEAEIPAGADGREVFRTKLVDGTFPDYERVIPQEQTVFATVKRAELAAALGRLAVVSQDRGHGIRIALNGGASGWLDAVAAPGGERGEAEESLDAEVTGVDGNARFQIGFNGRYLGDVLAALGGDAARLACSDASAPALITDPAQPGFLSVLMPMRV